MSESDKMATHPPSPPFVPGPPFDDPTADVILRSSDGINFHVHRIVLSLASPFFNQMFTLPQPSAEPGVPVILVSEYALVLDRALRFWYPGAEPIASQTLDELREVLEAVVRKYDMQFAVPGAKNRLREYLDEDPVAVYAIACHHEWKDLALEAARSSLRLPIRTFESGPDRRPQLKYITGDAYHRLLYYHAECGQVAKLASSSLKWTLGDDFPGSGCGSTSSICPMDHADWESAISDSHSIAAWFAAYLRGLPALLGTTPAADLYTPELLTLVLNEIPADCTFCKTTGMGEVARFASDLRAHIAMKTDSVELKLDF
ncbi:hypothetical protein DFH09DRAFT_1164700 [Mycena vulgaris]|nr:hypothetical protein DFH09DRAFT_1164700 [Mycena vulgaris]